MATEIDTFFIPAADWANVIERSTTSGAAATGPDAAGEYYVIAGIKGDTTITIAAPAAFTIGQWSVDGGPGGGELVFTISALPNRNGKPITKFQYALDGDQGTPTWVDLPAGTSTGTYTVTGLSGGTTYTGTVAIRAVNAIGSAAVSDLKTATVTDDAPPSGMVSDTFDTEISSSIWTYYGHVNGSAAWASGGYAQLNTDNATRYGTEASRLEQVSADTNFQVTVNFNTLLGTVPFQFQGFEVWQDANDWMQVYVERDASGFVAQRTESVAGTLTDIDAVAVTQADTAYMRLTRTGNDWTFETSPDGSAWTTRLTFTFALTVARVGLCTGTAGSGPAMATLINSFTVS